MRNRTGFGEKDKRAEKAPNKKNIAEEWEIYQDIEGKMRGM